MSATLKIAITCGDVNGIGPEVALKALAACGPKSGADFIPIGPQQVFNFPNTVEIPLAGKVTPGKITAAAARTAVAAVERAVQGCLTGEFDAVVTAPICKQGLTLAGIAYPGHTELIADLCKTKRYGMMLAGKELRVMLATRHLPLRDVAGALSKENVLDAIELTGETLAWFGLNGGHIGVCGLNPHAGDGGTLGDEEEKIIAPAIAAARAAGFNASGPVPADVIFFQALHNQYDAIVAMYHDQGLGPLKMHAFDCGINLTAGLPIVRTSPDHGTAFDIAGTNSASPASMIAAIEIAIHLAGEPNPWKT
ncbi:MAG: 4-hydroxythreonine-4-phosphate dehydrogenase PdxA [Kiritimatiellales bacterium]